MATHKTDIRVRFGDTDMAGVVYIVQYINYFMYSFEDLFRSLGVPVEDMIKTEIKGFPPTEVNSVFKAPAYCGDLLEVHTNVARIFKKGITLKFVLFNKEDEKLLATGAITFVSINEKRKPISLPQHLLDRLREYEEETPLNKEVLKRE